MPLVPFDAVEYNRTNQGTLLGNVGARVVKPDGSYQRLYVDGQIYNDKTDPREKYKDLVMYTGYPGSVDNKLTGYTALMSAVDENGEPLYKGEDPVYTAYNARKPGDVRNSFAWKAGQAVQRNLKDLNLPSPFKSKWGNIITGTALGAGGLALASWLAGKAGLPTVSPTTGAIVGGTAGLLTSAWLNGLKNSIPLEWYKKQQEKLYQMYKPASVNTDMEKQATLYHDPRNFILEKLQRDTELSMSDKAILAGKIRQMSLPEANSLESTVRSALGVGVGAIIARHFGLGPVGALMGGMLGGLASNAMRIGNGMFDTFSRPSLYNAFNQGGIGFDTYNQFFSLVNR